MTLTKAEKARVEDIRMRLQRLRDEGHDVSTWEATFFLKILDRNMKRRSK